MGFVGTEEIASLRRATVSTGVEAQSSCRPTPNCPYWSDLQERLIDSGLLVRSHEERRCSILGPTQSRSSPSVLEYTTIGEEMRDSGERVKELGAEGVPPHAQLPVLVRPALEM